MKFEKLNVYKKTRKFVNMIYCIVKNFPKFENYGLTSQLTRASVSVLANLCEGCGRYTTKERNKFFRTSRSSAYECVALLQIAVDQNYISEETYLDLKKEIEEISRMLTGMIK